MRSLLVIGALVVGCAQAPAADDYGDSTANVQRASEAHFTVATTSLTGALARAQRATGALIVPRFIAGEAIKASDGTRIRATCGATFIDRTHAITAGHCADGDDVPDPTTRTLDIELIDVAPSSNWRAATKVTGTFPDYERAAITGVSTTTLTCSIVHKCGTRFSEYECPPRAKAADADIMMLECPQGLPADREPVEVAASDAERSGAVKAFWFHEIIDAPFGLDGKATAENADDLFAHYTASDPDMVSNFHYFGDDRNQLLPLISAEWASGAARRRLGRSGNVVWTDLFGCHGTSGSGVMQLDARTGRYQLLGPVANGGRDWGFTRLCTDPATHRPGQQNLSYTALEFAKEMAALTK